MRTSLQKTMTLIMWCYLVYTGTVSLNAYASVYCRTHSFRYQPCSGTKAGAPSQHALKLLGHRIPFFGMFRFWSICRHRRRHTEHKTQFYVQRVIKLYASMSLRCSGGCNIATPRAAVLASADTERGELTAESFAWQPYLMVTKN